MVFHQIRVIFAEFAVSAKMLSLHSLIRANPIQIATSAKCHDLSSVHLGKFSA